ncbi:Trypsin [Amycolatopsis xylanica]|uniref:Trypsin n=1 Tax=Amycolatopsis xylanica TaxID=589385 RepID=A0A1H2V7W0_9PSEU|nr:serine protease [Amycolatopsis xylanica]SDW64426.1 Trypsin [Amycolatopsis xylanica]
MRKRLLALCLLAAVAGAAGVAGPASARPMIVGGSDASETYGFMASVQNELGHERCGASLISPEWLVTAGHCVSDRHTGEVLDPALTWIRVGSLDRTQGGERIRADRFIRHEKFDMALHHDIALVHLAAPVAARPIAIGAAPATGAAIRLLGWGKTCPTPGCGEAPVLLRELDTTVAGASACGEDFDPALQLCTDNKNGTANACFGDSGGPAVVADGGEWKLVGATSHGQSASCVDKAGIYTNVVAYADWIKQNT